MKLKRILFQLVLVASVAGIGIGCGGISASQSVSPATFLLPGLGLHKEQAPPETEVAPRVAALDVYSAVQ